MPKFGAISRADLIKNLRLLGFAGPFSGGNHEFMRKEGLKIIIPNPHKGDVSSGFLNKILK